jgi:hypothetical protein
LDVSSSEKPGREESDFADLGKIEGLAFFRAQPDRRPGERKAGVVICAIGAIRG